MKKVLSVLMIGVLLLGITGCNSRKDDNNKTETRIGKESSVKIEHNNVIFKLKDSTLTQSRGTFILENNSDLTIGYSESYYIEKEQSGKWYLLEQVSDRVFLLPLYYLKPHETTELIIGIDYGYGKLTPGKYRVVKNVFFEYENDKQEKFDVAAEFTIN